MSCRKVVTFRSADYNVMTVFKANALLPLRRRKLQTTGSKKLHIDLGTVARRQLKMAPVPSFNTGSRPLIMTTVGKIDSSEQQVKIVVDVEIRVTAKRPTKSSMKPPTPPGPPLTANSFHSRNNAPNPTRPLVWSDNVTLKNTTL